MWLVPLKGMLDPSVGGNIGPGSSLLSFDFNWASAANKGCVVSCVA